MPTGGFTGPPGSFTGPPAPSGVGQALTLTAKGQTLDQNQTNWAKLICSMAQQLGANQTAATACIYAAIWESTLGDATAWNSGGYGGILDGNQSAFGHLGSDSSLAVGKAEITSFFEGGLGFNTGALKLSASVGATDFTSAVVTMATTIEGGGPYNGETGYTTDMAAVAEAQQIVQAFAAGLLPGGIAGAGGTGTARNAVGNYMVGDVSNPNEDYWTAINRIAQARYWYLFGDGETVYLADGPDLMAQKPVKTLDRFHDASIIHHLEFQWDNPLWIETPVPTPDGWTTMGALRPGDRVLGSDGRPTRVRGVSPVFTDRDCYRLTLRDGTSVIADDHHHWETLALHRDESTLDVPRHQRYRGIRTTREIRETLNVMTRNGAHPNHRIRNAAPLDLPERDLPIDPYILGYWLGDGDSGGPGITVGVEDKEELLSSVVSAGYSCAVKERAPRGISKLPAYRVSVSPLPEYGYGRRGDNTLTGRLRALNVLGDKHVPSDYLRASREQRLELLRGLMDSDGSIGGDRHRGCTLGFANKRLADGAVELLRTLGFRTTGARWKAPQGRAREQWSIDFQVKEGMNCFRLERKRLRYDARLSERRRNIRATSGPRERTITSITRVPSVPVRCIEVESPDHLFLVGEGFCLTRNTAFQYASNHLKRAKVQRRSTLTKVQSPVEGTLELICNIDEVRAGDVIYLTSCGPGNGRWLVGDCTRSIFSIYSTLTLVPALQPLQEIQVAGAGSAGASSGSQVASTGIITAKGLTNPFPDGWTPGRADMGYDGTFTNRIVAPFDGVILYAGPFNNWPGPGGVIIQANQNLGAAVPTNTLYFVEQLQWTVATGQAVKAGTQIAKPGGSPMGLIEWGVSQSGPVGNQIDAYAVQLGNGSSASAAMVLKFIAWAVQDLGVANYDTTDPTNHPGKA